METKSLVKLIIGGIIGIFLLVVIFSSFAIVNAGERGVVLNWGAVSQDVRGEGLHWLIPFKQSMKIVDVKNIKIETKTQSYSKDIQTVDVSLALNYNVKPDLAAKIYQEVGTTYQSTIIDPAIQESVKAAVALFTAQELIEQRPKVKDAITLELTNRLSNYFVVSQFSITDFSFSNEYEKAVEAKQVAQQKALEQENITKQVEEQKKQTILAAQAQAEAIKIQAEAITQQGGADYVKLQAINKWNGILPTQFVPGSAIPFLDLTTK
jgi:regulator of protease activity HflC (stomatin/prohibitin superfamily)